MGNITPALVAHEHIKNVPVQNEKISSAWPDLPNTIFPNMPIIKYMIKIIKMNSWGGIESEDSVSESSDSVSESVSSTIRVLQIVQILFSEISVNFSKQCRCTYASHSQGDFSPHES